MAVRVLMDARMRSVTCNIAVRYDRWLFDFCDRDQWLSMFSSHDQQIRPLLYGVNVCSYGLMIGGMVGLFVAMMVMVSIWKVRIGMVVMIVAVVLLGRVHLEKFPRVSFLFIAVSL